MSVRRKSYSKDCARRRLSVEQLERRQLLAVNIAQFQPTFADSTSGGTAGEVTDGIVSQEYSWTSQDNTNQHWVEVQLQTPYPVGSAHVYLGQRNIYNAASFDLQYHDGSAWQTITSVTGATSTDHNLVFPETITATRFRIHTAVDSQLSVKELVLLPANGPAGYPLGTGVNLNVVSQLAPTATSVAGTNYAINAVDGYASNDSSWVSDNSAGPHRLTHALPAAQFLRSVHLYSGEVGSDGTVVNPISDFSLQFERPGGTFQAVPIASVSSGTISGGSVTGNTSGELVINFKWPISARRIRINTNQASAMIREMVVMPAYQGSGDASYPIGTSVELESPPTTKYDDYGDAWYRIVSRQNNRAIVADETGASQTVDATPDVERQYQLLYSYALGAFRIRSEDTGLALQVNDASLDAGAAIVEGEYSAAPHQLWRLEPTDGGHFQVVNVWSGMVLHTGGAYPNEVTQQPFDEAADPANRVEWRMVFNKDYFKKGIGVIGEAEAFRPSWAYNWGLNSDGSGELPDDVFHTPMQWGRWNLGTIHQRYDDWNSQLQPSYLLGYNEPDGVNQANMTVEEGIDLWPQLEAMDVPLLSPALTHNGHGRTWLTDFADQADALGFRQDYAGMHWYGAPNVNNILNYVNTIQSISNGRDVWITEFSPVDWSGGSGNWSEETNYSFILEFMYRADRKENLDKYALFPFVGDQPDTPWAKSNPRANSFIGEVDGELTPYGKAYASWDGESDPELETLYVIHNRAASHRLQNTGSDDVDKASIRVEDESAQWIIQDAGNDEVFITSVVDGRRAKLDAGNIVMSDPGATGWGVRWKIEHDQYGWHNIVHSGSGDYLRLNRVNNGAGAPVSQTLDVVAPTNSNSTDWWFVKPYDAAIHSDFGDAPSSYPVALADDGARHFVGGPQLGPLADAETDGVHSADGLLDDTSDSDDEDGVTFATTIFASTATAAVASVDVQLVNADPTSNRLDAWIDFNKDGDWLDDGEQIFSNFNLGTTDGTQKLNFTVPQDTGTNVEDGDTYARFRVSTAGNLGVTGQAFDGEVEDHRVAILTNSLSVSIAAASISEAGGAAATTATVTRNADTTNDLTVTLTSDDTTEASLVGTVTILAGNASATFNIDAENDAIVDGSQIATITARATGHFDGTDTVLVTDDDTPSLALTIAAGAISEGAGAAATTGTVTRNTDTTNPFTVTLSSSDIGEATVPESVTIPAGASSVSFDIDAVDDGVLDPAVTVTVTASATNFDSGSADVVVEDVLNHRMSELTVIVQDQDGNLLPDATLDVSMTRHGFTFGTQVRHRLFGITQPEFDALNDSQKTGLLASGSGSGLVPTWTDVLNYRDAVYTHFNHIVPTNGMQWIAYNNAGPTHVDTAINLAQAEGFSVTGHAAVWGKNGWPTPNEYRSAANPDPQEFLDALISDRLSSSGIMARYSDVGVGPTITDWDVLNEPLHEHYFANTFVSAGLFPNSTEFYADIFRRAHAVRPDARLAVNDYNIITSNGDAAAQQYRDFVNSVNTELAGEEASIEVIKVQAHTWLALSKADITRRLDILAETGLPIVISEFDMRDDAGQLSASQQEATFRNFLEASFEHPSVEAFTMWGFWDPGHWRSNGPLFEEDWTFKTEAAPWMDLVQGEWKSEFLDQSVDANARWINELALVDGHYSITARDGLNFATVEDVVLSGDREFTITIDIVDPALTLSIDAAAVSEGDGPAATTATVTRNSDTTNPLMVTLSSNDPSEASVVGTITIPAGHASATFEIDADDDAVVDGTQTVTINATATNHAAGSDTVDVTDDDLAMLTVSIGAGAISENGGTTTATVSRNTDTTDALTVTLSSTDTGEAIVPTTITIPAGETTSAPFNITGVNDSVVDGTQTVTINAMATDHAAGSDTVDVTDDDLAMLTVAIGAGAISENGGTTTATVSRNTDTTASLTVTLSSSDTGEAIVPTTITIPAGQTISAPFTISSVNDAVVDGTQTVTVNATATDHAGGGDAIDVTDNDTSEISIIAIKNALELGKQDGEFLVSITSASELETEVELSVDGTALEGFDFTTLPTRVTIPAGQFSATLLVPVVDDSEAEALETVSVSLDAVVSGLATIDSDRDSATITIEDNDSDFTAPSATVRALPLSTNSSTFELTVDLDDPSGPDGQLASGVASYDVYVAVDGDTEYTLWADDVAAAQTTLVFTPESNRRYWFRAQATDHAGNVETESAYSAPEANTLVADIGAPTTSVTGSTSNSETGVITLSLHGTDVGNSGLRRTHVFVSIDGAPAVEVPMSAIDGGTPDGSGVYVSTLEYQAMRDGVPHTYQFFTQGVDGAGNVEAAHAASDLELTETFAAPASGLAADGINVQDGQRQRSYINNVDVLFNNGLGLQSLIDNNRIRVERFGLNETTPDLGTGDLVSGFSATTDGNAINLDFGSSGIGGSGRAGNGFYRIALDLDGDGTFDDASFEFFRLYGDGNGDGKVTSADRRVREDLNGDGAVNARDRSVWRRERNRKLNSDLFGLLDD